MPRWQEKFPTSTTLNIFSSICLMTRPTWEICGDITVGEIEEGKLTCLVIDKLLISVQDLKIYMQA